MTNRFLIMALVMVFFFISKPVLSADLSVGEITAIYSEKTVNGYHHKRDFSFTRYFASDGTIIGVSDKKGKRKGKWKAQTNKLCLQWNGGKDRCRKIEKDGDVMRQFDKKGNKNTVTYKTFVDGNKL